MNMRWIGIFTLGGLVAVGLEVLRRTSYMPIPPTRLLDTTPGTVPDE